MYLRYTTRKKDGKVHRTWRLVRSVRTDRRVVQQTVAHLGELDEAGRLRARALARALIGEPEQAELFDEGTRSQTVGVRVNPLAILTPLGRISAWKFDPGNLPRICGSEWGAVRGNGRQDSAATFR